MKADVRPFFCLRRESARAKCVVVVVVFSTWSSKTSTLNYNPTQPASYSCTRIWIHDEISLETSCNYSKSTVKSAEALLWKYEVCCSSVRSLCTTGDFPKEYYNRNDKSSSSTTTREITTQRTTRSSLIDYSSYGHRHVTSPRGPLLLDNMGILPQEHSICM